MKKIKHSINLKIPQELNLEIDKILINKRVEEPNKTHRKQDLIRWGKLLETVRNTKVTKHAQGAATNIQSKHVKYPIPLNEILTNPVLLKSDPTNNGYR